MKILQVIDQLQVGGAERVAVDLSIILHQRGVDVDFLCLLDASELDDELIDIGINILYLKRNYKYNPVTLYKLKCILINYDIIHVHLRHVLRYVFLANFIFPFNIKFKIVFHDHYGNIDNNAHLSYHLKKCIQNTSAYIGVSHSLCDWALKNKLNARVYLLTNIIRKNAKTKSIKTMAKIISIGNFRHQKNYDFLLRLMEVLPKELSIDIYGKINDEDYYNDIQQKIDKMNLRDRINIFSQSKNLLEILNNYTLAIHCSASETGPLVAIEYMSQGLPFIMYNTGAVAEALPLELKGLLMTTFDVLSWKSKILEFLSEHNNLQWRKKLQAFYQTNYSEQHYFNQCMKIYQQIENS